jgi:hypothetical protein
MTVDVGDMISRLRRVLPVGWFADVAPLADAVLSGIGTAYVAVYDLIAAVKLQTRIGTATGIFLDFISTDFFGGDFPRRQGESDSSFRQRVSLELLRPRATRAALMEALTDLTAQPVQIFEPMRPADTGSYNSGGAGYGVAGGLGNLSLAYQCFVIAGRPRGGGIALLAGYGSGGLLYYGSAADIATSVSDADIFGTVAAVLPTGYIAWVQIQN